MIVTSPPPGFFRLLLPIFREKATVSAINGVARTGAERETTIESMSEEERASALAWMRNSELKHARLAMLATLGWVAAEKLNAKALYFTTNGKAPSLFNGHLLDYALPLVVVFGGFAALEFLKKEEGGLGGDFASADGVCGHRHHRTRFASASQCFASVDGAGRPARTARQGRALIIGPRGPQAAAGAGERPRGWWPRRTDRRRAPTALLRKHEEQGASAARFDAHVARTARGPACREGRSDGSATQTTLAKSKPARTKGSRQR